jgi:hypothetical protein
MHSLIPLWIIGGPFVGLLILSFSFKGPSTMGGFVPRLEPRRIDAAVRRDTPVDPAAPLLDPMHPTAPRRFV